ncbi:MAG: hypothetical protein M1834_001706 [Cirrosporium novae-zelandiae]|nr:MAG: hypothetical protein M1834_001706 [Cirrosporium novae-zelandiae]
MDLVRSKDGQKMAKKDVKAAFTYLKWLDKYEKEKPYELLSGASREGENMTNLEFQIREQEELVSDVRGEESLFQLDSHGFCFRNTNTDFSAFYDREQVEGQYIPEIVKPLLKNNLDEVDRMFIFDWHLRRNESVTAPLNQNLRDGTQPYAPAMKAHIDQSPLGTARRVRHHLGSEADELLKGRVRIINFWRPLYHTIVDAPLALCDGSTVARRDCVFADFITRDYRGETTWMLPSKEYKWYYLRDQRPEEAILLKIFDSDNHRKAKCCPHASFILPDVPLHAPPRESIEIRALVFTNR